MKQLLLDISELVQRDKKTGIHRVVWGILRELMQNSPEGWKVEPVYATSDAIGYRYARDFTRMYLDSNHEHANNEMASIRAGDIFFGLDYNWTILPRQASLLKKWHSQGVQIQFLVYDLCPFTMPIFFPDKTDLKFLRWLKLISQFDGIVCISRCVADEYYNWLQTYGPKRDLPILINWYHNGIHVENCGSKFVSAVNITPLFIQFNLRPTFIMVGTIEPRKGHIQTLQAFTQLWRDGYDINLLIVGQRGWMYADIVHQFMTHPELGTRLFWLPAANDDDLVKIYSISTCLIAASFAEGFGLPLHEAAKYHVPIIARDLPIFHEITGKHAYFFNNDNNPSSLAKAVADWLTLYKTGHHPKSENIPHLTWKESVGNLLDAIMERNCYRTWVSR